MSKPTVQTVYDLIGEIAPYETAEDYDNVGLLVGRYDRSVSRILCSLDITMEMVEEALRLGAELIVTHHPLMFHARKNLREGEPEADILCSLVREKLSLISAHTNLDQTVYSGSASVARGLGLSDIRQYDPFVFLGDFAPEKSAGEVAAMLRERFQAPVRMYGDEKRPIRTLALCGGAYGMGYLDAEKAGAQAYLTGEIRHSDITDAVARGIVIFDAGHYASEAPMIPGLRDYLQNALNERGYSAQVLTTACVPFPGALE